MGFGNARPGNAIRRYEERQTALNKHCLSCSSARESVCLGKDGWMDGVFVAAFPCLPLHILICSAFLQKNQIPDRLRGASHRKLVLFFRDYVATLSHEL